MGERKVINKYYPPDFDPSLIPRGKKPKNDQQTVRMMMPMSVRCLTCGEYLYRGKKFNAKKETVAGEEYLGIKVFRFYMKCTRCKGEFTIKTDPERADYIAELNVSRNFEPWRNTESQIEEAKEKRKLEEEGDVMKQLENRTTDSKVELDILDALADIKSLNTRNARLDLDKVIEERTKEAQQKELEEEEELVQALFRDRHVKRLDDDDDDADPFSKPLDPAVVAPLAPSLQRPAAPVQPSSVAEDAKKKRKAPFPFVPLVVKPKASGATPQQKKVKVEPPLAAAVKVESGGADSNSDDDEGAGGGLLGLDY
jgi:hypothetical protein